MIRVWTQSARARFLASASVGDADRRAGTDELIDALARLHGVLGEAAPGVALWNVVANKLAGYNARLESWFAMAAAVERAAGADPALGGARLLMQTARGLYPQELMLRGLLHGRGGRSIQLRGDGEARRLLARHNPPWSSQPDYVPFEVPITGPGPGLRDVPGRPSSAVFVASMSNYLNPMSPVMRDLCDLGIPCIVLIPREAAAWPTATALDRRARVLWIEDLIDGPAWSGHQADAARVQGVLSRAQGEIERVVRCLGIPLWELVGSDVMRTLRDFLPQASTFRRAGTMLGQRVGARVVVAARLRRVADGALTIGLRDAGARCVLLPHGHMAPDPRSEFGAGSFDAADVVAAWGPDQARTLTSRRRRDCPPERVLACGNPEWDRLRDTRSDPGRRAAARKQLLARLKLPPHSRVAVIVSQPVGPVLLRAVADACVGLDGWTFVVKAHPTDSLEHLKAALGLEAEQSSNGPLHLVRHGERPLHDLLRAADVGVVFSSTANIEALLLGTPVITLEPPGLESFQRHPKLESYGLPLARSALELRRLLLDFERWQPGCEAAIRRVLLDTLPAEAEPSAGRRIIGVIRNFLEA